MTYKEKVIAIAPNAIAHDTGKMFIISVNDRVVAQCPIRRESWAWALALRELKKES